MWRRPSEHSIDYTSDYCLQNAVNNYRKINFEMCVQLLFHEHFTMCFILEYIMDCMVVTKRAIIWGLHQSCPLQVWQILNRIMQNVDNYQILPKYGDSVHMCKWIIIQLIQQFDIVRLFNAGNVLG